MEILTAIIIFLLILGLLLVNINGIIGLIHAYRENKMRKEMEKVIDKVLNYEENVTYYEEEEKTNDLIKELDEEIPEVKNVETTDYNKMNVAELKKIAQEKKIKGYYTMKKEELVKTLTEEDK